MAVAIGERVLIAKQKATVRYIGSVDGYEGSWIGVEWDDASRGKHDGSTGGQRYFTCESASPTAGSFIRASKVPQGTSLLDALVLRYTNKVAEGQAAGDAQVYLHTTRPSKLWFELVGEDQVTERQSKIELLRSARLVGACISRVGPIGALSSAGPNLRQLDLTDNLLSSWSAVSDICQQLPNLQLLVLSHNKLQLPSTTAEAVDQGLVQLPGLQCLVMNNCGITWQQVGVVQSFLPNLQELHVGGNNIASLFVDIQQQQQQQQQGADSTDSAAATAAGTKIAASDAAQSAGFINLQCLGLEDNSINKWSEVLRLAGLPALRRLHLSGNPLGNIIYPDHSIPPTALFVRQPPTASSPSSSKIDKQQQQQPFALLEALLLGGCCISSWGDVDALHLFPSLRETRLSGNPLFSAEGAAAAGRRFEVIGRVGGLTLLNGADVKPRERRDCELRYLQSIAAEAAETEQQQQQQSPAAGAAAAQHPRLAELQAKYGQVSAAAAKPAQQGTSISSTTAQLILQCGSSSSSSKKLPKTITVSALKLLCGRLFKMPPDQLQLLLLLPPHDSSGTSEEQQQHEFGGEDISHDDTKTLSYWDVTDGCVIRVSQVDLQQLRQEQEQQQIEMQQEQQQRIMQQLQQGEAIRAAAER